MCKELFYDPVLNKDSGERGGVFAHPGATQNPGQRMYPQAQHQTSATSCCSSLTGGSPRAITSLSSRRELKPKPNCQGQRPKRAKLLAKDAAAATCGAAGRDVRTTPKSTQCPDLVFTPPGQTAEVFSLKSFDVLTPRVRNGRGVFTERLQLPPFLQYDPSHAAQSR